MIRFEVTGATPEEFAQNAMSAWGLLAIGLQQALSVSIPTTGAQPTNGSESSSTVSKADEVSEEVVDFAMELDRRGSLIREKIEERKKVHSDKVDDLFAPEAECLTGGPPLSSPKPASKNTKPPKGPKLDDLKTRLSEVIVAATDRWDQKRANAYARNLLRGFGIEKLGELKAEQYEKFLEISEAYVDGVVAE